MKQRTQYAANKTYAPGPLLAIATWVHASKNTSYLARLSEKVGFGAPGNQNQALGFQFDRQLQQEQQRDNDKNFKDDASDEKLFDQSTLSASYSDDSEAASESSPNSEIDSESTPTTIIDRGQFEQAAAALKSYINVKDWREKVIKTGVDIISEDFQDGILVEQLLAYLCVNENRQDHASLGQNSNGVAALQHEKEKSTESDSGSDTNTTPMKSSSVSSAHHHCQPNQPNDKILEPTYSDNSSTARQRITSEEQKATTMHYCRGGGQTFQRLFPPKNDIGGNTSSKVACTQTRRHADPHYRSRSSSPDYRRPRSSRGRVLTPKPCTAAVTGTEAIMSSEQIGLAKGLVCGSGGLCSFPASKRGCYGPGGCCGRALCRNGGEPRRRLSFHKLLLAGWRISDQTP